MTTTSFDAIPELAKPREIAAYLRVSLNSIYEAVNRADNPMPAVRLGPHQLRVPRRALAAWLGLEGAGKSEADGLDHPSASEAANDLDNVRASR